ncbi:ThiF family adenylyltransferase [Virgibacillus necropolis]|uniref:MoeB/ThiF family adenylyltransferase n=1 Tax=Virgibacillus necropolis TaxID=163877 RepID=UPI00384E498F
MLERYSRQLLFPNIGEDGQVRLKSKHVLIVGVGALGTGNAEILTRSGIGKLTIIDRDYVEWSNLQRQQLFTEYDAENRVPKAIAAKRQLEKINSDVTIDAHIMDVTPVDLEHLLEDVDLIMDGTDNFDIRLIINDVSQKQNKPWIYGSCVGSYGISYTIIPGETPCLHCLMKQVPFGGLTCDTGGIISPVVGMVVAHQTVEALKILTGNWTDLRRNLISFDLWNNQQSAINVDQIKNQDCPSCGKAPSFPFLDYENQMKAAVLCGRETVQIRPVTKGKRNIEIIANNLSKVGPVKHNSFLLSFTVENYRLVMFQDGRVLVHGINDVEKAKTLYHRYFA